LRQYEPYWSPSDPGAAIELSELVQDITRLLADLRTRAPVRPPGLLSTFSPNERTGPHLVLVEALDESSGEPPDDPGEDRY
jgi:hypothetical protein